LAVITLITANLSPAAVHARTDVEQQLWQTAFDELKEPLAVPKDAPVSRR
jgi:hypothetical protein